MADQKLDPIIGIAINSTSIVNQIGKTFTVYEITVRTANDKWMIQKRYSVLHNFHIGIKDQYPNVPPFPSKINFSVDTRRVQLEEYLKAIIKIPQITSAGLIDALLDNTTQRQIRSDRSDDIQIPTNHSGAAGGPPPSKVESASVQTPPTSSPASHQPYGAPKRSIRSPPTPNRTPPTRNGRPPGPTPGGGTRKQSTPRRPAMPNSPPANRGPGGPRLPIGTKGGPKAPPRGRKPPVGGHNNNLPSTTKTTATSGPSPSSSSRGFQLPSRSGQTPSPRGPSISTRGAYGAPRRAARSMTRPQPTRSNPGPPKVSRGATRVSARSMVVPRRTRTLPARSLPTKTIGSANPSPSPSSPVHGGRPNQPVRSLPTKTIGSSTLPKPARTYSSVAESRPQSRSFPPPGRHPVSRLVSSGSGKQFRLPSNGGAKASPRANQAGARPRRGSGRPGPKVVRRGRGRPSGSGASRSRAIPGQGRAPTKRNAPTRNTSSVAPRPSISTGQPTRPQSTPTRPQSTPTRPQSTPTRPQSPQAAAAGRAPSRPSRPKPPSSAAPRRRYAPVQPGRAPPKPP